MTKPIAWTIAGSDSGGGAGIQADLKTFQALNVHGCSVITAITAQNSITVSDIAIVPIEHINSQIKTLHCDLPANAIKLGMLATPVVIKTVAAFLKNNNAFIVCDPVMTSTTQAKLLQPNAKKTLIQELFPQVDLVTPNIMEAQAIIEHPIKNYSDMEHAAKKILTLGPKSVLIKGGHSHKNDCRDYWTDGKTAFWLSSPKQNTINTHGSGCILSAAITACLALDYDIKDALVIAKMYVNQGIRTSEQYGSGPGPITHGPWPENQIDLPKIYKTLDDSNYSFPNCGTTPLGLYPIVDRSHWLEKLLPLGVSTIQLRIKDKTGQALENEIKRSITLAKYYNARLFINDYWDLAIEHGAYGVHLGQTDIDHAAMYNIYKSGLRLGISTHCCYEVARAHAFNPSYVAYGPIFRTTTKIMPFKPQGIEQLKRWRRTLDYRLVAIGGIGSQQLTSVLKTNVDGIAMMSAITKATDPINTTTQFLGAIYNCTMSGTSG